MKKNIYIYLILALFFASEIYLLRQNSSLKEEILLKDRYLERVASKYTSIEEQFLVNIVNCGSIVDSSLTIKDTSGLSIPLSDIARGKIICRYSESHCRQCVEHAISVVTDNRDSLKASDFIFIGDGGKRIQNLNVKEFGLQDFVVVDCQDIGIPAEADKFPYFISLDNDLRVRSIYFPNKSTHGTDYDYRHIKYMYDWLIHKNR